MDWEISHLIEEVTLDVKEEEKLTLLFQVPTATPHFRKLLEDATQATLDFEGGYWEGDSVIGLRLKNANGEFYLALQRKDWEFLEEQPDELTFVYDEGEKGNFTVPFLNRMFEGFLEAIIDQYNEGNREQYILDMICVFAEEEDEV